MVFCKSKALSMQTVCIRINSLLEPAVDKTTEGSNNNNEWKVNC